MSNRLTFSLASLIFLIALGLIFVPTSVLAHGPNTIGNLRSHTHPVNTVIPGTDLNADGDTLDIGEGEVSTHNAHPIPTLSLKPDAANATPAKVKDNMVVIGAAPSGGQTTAIDANEFVLVVDFDQDVVNTSNQEAVDRANETLPTLSFLSATVNANGVAIANGVQLGTPARAAGTDNSKFEIVVLVDSTAIPTGTAALKTATVRVQLRQTMDDNVGGTTESIVFGLAKTPQFTQVPGAESEASNYFEITLVQTLPTPDTAGPAAAIKPPTALVNGMATFEISFDEALGTDALTLSDLTITGQQGNNAKYALTGTLSENASATLPTYDLEVRPFSPMYGFVKVVLAAGAVNDALGNKSAAASSIFTIPDRQKPEVDIWVGSTRNQPVYGEGRSQHVIQNGQVNFMLEFSEPMQKNPNTVSRLEATDFTVMQYGARNGEVDLTSGVVVPDSKLTLTDISSTAGDLTAWTASLNPDASPQKQVDIYRLSVGATDMFNEGGQHIRIELRVREVTDQAGNTVETWLVGQTVNDLVDVYPYAVFDTIPPIVKKITPGYVVDMNSPTTPNTMRDDTFVPLAMTGGKYIGKARQYVAFKFEFSEPLSPPFTTDDLDSDGLANGRYIRDSKPYPVDRDGAPLTGHAASDPDNLTYVVVVETVDQSESTTILMRRRSIWDRAGNFLQDDIDSTYTVEGDATPPVVAIKVADVLNCDVGNAISFDITDPESKPITSGLAATETVTAVDKDPKKVEVTVSKGWKIVDDHIIAGVPQSGYWLVPMGDGSEHGVTTVTVTVAAGAIMDKAGNKSVETKTKTPLVVGPVLTIPAGGYTVVVRSEHEPYAGASHLGDPLYVGSLGVRGQIIDPQPWDCMPDLTVFFGRKASPRPGIGGGALVVKVSPKHTGNKINTGTVGISEIMWASDEGIPHGGVPGQGLSNLDQTREQWIELHNINNFDVTVTLFAYPDEHAVRMKQEDGVNEIDRMSNYEIANSWSVEGKGQSGNSALGTDFVSMWRPNADAKGYGHGDFGGTNKDKWKSSTHIYLTRQSTLWQRLDTDDLTYDFIGTPGRSNTLTVSTPLQPSKLAKSPVIFNEIANRTDSNRYYEWIELRNVTDAEVNLREYRISYLTAKDTEHELYNFPDNDNIKIAAKSVLLLVDTDPSRNEDHPVAADNPNVKYVVTDFKDMGLPDDGEFVLVLRTNDGDKLAALKSANKIIDVAGWDDDLVDNSKYTKVWPLQVWQTAPYTHNKIEVETVHQRRDAGRDGVYGEKNEAGKTSFHDVGYSGIGYKRLIPDIAAHGGTPGYDNGVAKEYNDGNATASAAPVTISEIMYDSNTRLPQWIELYNSSKTEVVKVEDWTLMLENADDVHVRTPRVSVKLAAKLIQPNQTILIVSSATGNHSDHFTDARIIDIWRNGLKDKDRLEISVTNRRAFKFLSETAFKITLKDKAGKVVDVAGNRGADGSAMWKLPMAEDTDVRSSIIRRYNEGKLSPANTTKGQVKDGTLPVWSGKGSLEDAGGGDAGDAGWILASESHLYEAHENTFYGNITDKGTPGYRGGGPVPVSLSKFRPERLESGDIVIRWVTESELNNAGFNILRSTERNGQFTQINTSLIAGQGTTSEKTNYEWKDTTAKPNVVYYYQIQDVSLDGKVQTLRQSRLKGYLTPAGKLTTTWGDLKALQ